MIKIGQIRRCVPSALNKQYVLPHGSSPANSQNSNGFCWRNTERSWRSEVLDADFPPPVIRQFTVRGWQNSHVKGVNAALTLRIQIASPERHLSVRSSDSVLRNRTGIVR
jgi:hypothetical protein